MDDEPFVFPKDVIQVYNVEDRINVGWKLVVPLNSRSNLVVYKHKIVVDHEEGGPEDAEEDAMLTPLRSDEEDVIIATSSARYHSGCSTLVGIQANDDIGKDMNKGDEEDKEDSKDDAEESYSNKDDES